jgi:hypothetical protein
LRISPATRSGEYSTAISEAVMTILDPTTP